LTVIVQSLNNTDTVNYSYYCDVTGYNDN